MKNNKGMTMIEVVVVIALIAIITSGTALSVSSLRKARVKKQYDILQAQVINLRENTLTSSDLTAGGIYYESATGEYYFGRFELERSKMLSMNTATFTNNDIKSTLEERVLLNSKFEYFYSFDGGLNKVKITESQPLIIHFDRSDGRLVNNNTNTKVGQLIIYVSNGSEEKTFSVSCTTGRIVGYN